MELRVLGTVEAVTGDRLLSLRGTKPRTLIATLALSHGETVPDTRLSAMLWGTRPPATASSQLYTYMSRLRKLLDPDVEIVRKPPGYLLDLGATALDYADFTHLTEQGQELLAAGEHEAAANRLDLALARWHGRALGGVTTFLAEAEGPRLNDARLAALEARVAAELALGRHHTVIPELTALVAEHPLRERLRAQLMIALSRDNRQAEALAVYDAGRRRLADELGIAPGALLSETFRTILRGAQPQTTRSAPARSHSPPATLPPDVSDFTGRERLLTALTSSTDRVIITGMAGVGKTALAVRAAHEIADSFPDGQLFVDLGGAEDRPRDPAEVLGWFLRMLGTPDVPPTIDERTQLYRTRLTGQRVLIVLDNAGSGTQLAPLLPTATTCRVIATARRHPTVLAGATTVELDVLPPSDSLAMLTAIVGRDRVRSEPDAARQLSELVGHLPVALRVAGARLAAWQGRPLSHLVRRLTSAPSILDELVVAELDVRARLAHSCRGLGEVQLAALQRLSHLASADIPLWAAARSLAMSPAAAETLLDDLVEARLVQLGHPDPNGQPRFRIHPLIRELSHDQHEIRHAANLA